MRLVALVALGSLGGCSASLDSIDTAGKPTPTLVGAEAGSTATAQVAKLEPTVVKSTTRNAPRVSAGDSIMDSGSTTAIASLPEPTGKLPPGPGSPSYKIGALDLLEVVVYKVPDLTRVVTVAENGAVNLPLIGETSVAGLTAQELERDLAKRLGAKYLAEPTSFGIRQRIQQSAE